MGYRRKPENLRSWWRHIRVLSDVPVSRNWYKTITKHLYVRFLQDLYINGFNKYATNQRSLRNSRLLILLLEFNNFSFLIVIIDNIIYESGTCQCHQNSNRSSTVLLSCVSICISWPVYCTTIGGSSGHVIHK